MKIFDTHCHPNLNFKKDIDFVINNFFQNGGEYLNLIGTNLETNQQVLDIASNYNNVYVSIGIHPCDCYDLDLDKSLEFLEKLLYLYPKKIIGIGECGLDYYWLENDELSKTHNINDKKNFQKKFFKAQIELAKKYNLPLIIHNRDSKNDIYDILIESGYKNFIFHCYTENLEYAEKLLKFSPDCKISFSGILTFKNAQIIQDVAKNIPLENIFAETDSPYLTPAPYRGKEENEPLFTKYVIEKISELKGLDCSDQIFTNSINFFKIVKN